MASIALIDKQPSNTDYTEYYPLEGLEVDHYHLSSKRVPKLLKKDVDIEFDPSGYDYVILVGSEALKYYTKKTSITSLTGSLIEGKYIAAINPAIGVFKPEALPEIKKTADKMAAILSGERVSTDKYTKHLIQDAEEAVQFIKRISRIEKEHVSLDTETSGFDPRKDYLLGLSISYATKDLQVLEGAYIDADVLEPEVLEALVDLISSNTIVMHNAKFDKLWFKHELGITFDKVEDTMLMHYALDERQGTHGLKPLAIQHTDLGDYDSELEIFKKEYCKHKKIKEADFSYAFIPFEILGEYAALDTVATSLLYLKFRKALEKSEIVNTMYKDVLLPASSFIGEMEEFGVPFDTKRLELAGDFLEKELFSLQENFYSLPELKAFEAEQGAPLNFNSPIQLRKFLFDTLNLKSTGKKTGTGADSTDAEVLQELAKVNPIPKTVLDIKQKHKIKSTYIDKIIVGLDKDNRLRTGFNLIATTSGRLSSSGKLNMQQLPRDNPIVKGCIVAREGYSIVSQDLKTAEMWVAAALSKDPNLIRVFKEGGDFHGAVAKMVFHLDCSVAEVKDKYPAMRQAAKAISFGILYGSGPSKVAETVADFYLKEHIEKGVPLVYFSREDAQDSIDRYFEAYPRLKAWLSAVKKEINANGFVYSPFGRKRRLRNVFSSDKGIAAKDRRSGVNFMIQSPASDINLLGAVELSKRITRNKIDAGIFALVHDAILAEVRDEHVDSYLIHAKECVQMDWGVSIPNCPIGVDVEVGKDYSFGKLEKEYPLLAA